jgi:hypothetical protein
VSESESESESDWTDGPRGDGGDVEASGGLAAREEQAGRLVDGRTGRRADR